MTKSRGKWWLAVVVLCCLAPATFAIRCDRHDWIGIGTRISIVHRKVVDARRRLYCDLPSRSRAHMLRGNVPPVEGKAQEIVTSAGKKMGHFASMTCSQSRACFLRLFLLRSLQVAAFASDGRLTRISAMRSPACPSQSGGTAPFFAFPPSTRDNSMRSFSRISAYQNIGPHRNRNRALGILAYRKTRDAKVGGLFLNAARIGDHHGCARLQSQKINIGERIEHAQLPGIQSKIGNSFARSWMGGKNHRQIPVHLEQRLQDSLQRHAIIDVGRPVQRDQGIALRQTICLVFAPTSSAPMATGARASRSSRCRRGRSSPREFPLAEDSRPRPPKA